MGWIVLKVETITKVDSLLYLILFAQVTSKFTSLSNIKHVLIIVVTLIFGLETKSSA
jgi:hypothetical protein